MTQKDEMKQLKERNSKLASEVAAQELIMEDLQTKSEKAISEQFKLTGDKVKLEHEASVVKMDSNRLKSEVAELESSRKGFELQIEGLRKDVDKYKAQKEELGASLNIIELENTELKAAVIKQAKLLCKDV
jgi:chromosome segregation ATPase